MAVTTAGRKELYLVGQMGMRKVELKAFSQLVASWAGSMEERTVLKKEQATVVGKVTCWEI